MLGLQVTKNFKKRTVSERITFQAPTPRVLSPTYTKLGKDRHNPTGSEIYVWNRAPPITALRKQAVVFTDSAGFQYYNAERIQLADDTKWCDKIREFTWFDKNRDRIFIIRKKIDKTEENVIMWPSANATLRIELQTEKGQGKASAVIIDSAAEVPIGMCKRSTNVVVLRDILYS